MSHPKRPQQTRHHQNRNSHNRTLFSSWRPPCVTHQKTRHSSIKSPKRDSCTIFGSSGVRFWHCQQFRWGKPGRPVHDRRNRSTSGHIFCIRQRLEKNQEYNKSVHQLLTGAKKAYDSLRRKVLYNFLIEFGIPLKLVRQIKMYLNETYSKVQVGKHWLIGFLLRMVWKREMLYHHCFSTLL